MKILNYILLAIFLIFPFGQLLRFRLPFLPPSVKFQPLDLLVGVFVFYYFLTKKKHFYPLCFKELAVFSFVATLSLLFKIKTYEAGDLLPAVLYLFRLLAYVGFYFSFFNYILCLQDNKQKNFVDLSKIKKILILEGVVTAFFSLLQYLILPDTRFLFDLGWDKHYFRAIGTFLDPSFTGTILVLAFNLWLSSLLNENRKRGFEFIFGFLLVLAIALTFSRAVYFVFFVSLAFFLFLSKKVRFNRILFAFLTVFLLALIFSPKPGGEGVNLLRTSSLFLKMDNYKQTWQIIRKNFVFGVGFNALRAVQKNYGFISENDWELTNAGAGVDNSFLFVMATTGIFGLAAFLSFWLKAIFISFKTIGQNKYSPVVFISLVTLTIISFSINGIFYPWILLWTFILLAVFSKLGNSI